MKGALATVAENCAGPCRVVKLRCNRGRVGGKVYGRLGRG